MRKLKQLGSPSVVIVDGTDPEAISDLSTLVLECEDLYPGIDRWFAGRVASGLRDGSRIGFLAYEGSRVAAGAILRRGENAKLCSLRVRDEFADQGFGTGLFNLAAREATRTSSTLHFTAPEELAVSESRFFRTLGFQVQGKIGRNYRVGQSEIAFAGNTQEIVERTEALVVPTLFGANVGATSDERSWLVMSIHPKFAGLIVSGAKTIELRRRFSAAHVGARILIYSTTPEKSLVGVATISGVSQVNTERPDDSLCRRACVDPEMITKYASGKKRIWAIHLSDVTAFERPLSLAFLSGTLKTNVRPPMSFGLAKRGSPWGRVADFLAMTSVVSLTTDSRNSSHLGIAVHP